MDTYSTPEGSAPAGLAEIVKQEIRDGLARIAQTPGFKPRRSQRLMIAEIAKTLAGEHSPEDSSERVICVEGPTGTGKSLGYLLSAIPVAKHLRLKLVISTATVALQEQLMTKDLPSLRNAGFDFSYALAKGRRRYVCDRNLEQLSGQGDQRSLDLKDEEGDSSLASWRIKPAPGDVDTVKGMFEARESGAWNGDLDEWPTTIRDDLKQVITTDRAGCTGGACPFRERCAFFRASAQRKEKDVIVANHALVMADLTLGGGVVLPLPEEAIYVFDEGHHLSSVAIDQGAARTHLLGPQSALNNLTKIPEAIRITSPDNPVLLADMDNFEVRLKEEVAALKIRIAALHSAIEELHPAPAQKADKAKRVKGKPGLNTDDEDLTWRFPRGVVPPVLREPFMNAFIASDALHQTAMKFVTSIKEVLEAKKTNQVVGMALASAQAIAGRIEEMLITFRLFAVEVSQNPKTPPYARWIERSADRRDFECCVNPTSAAELLRGLLWSQCRGAVIASATLAALGRFDRLFAEMGLGPKYGTRAIKLDSPFDYRRNAELIVPAMLTSAKDSDLHTDEIIDRCNNGLINPTEGTLMLFASYKQMKAVVQGLTPELASRVLMQNEAPRQDLLNTHRRRIEAGEGSILFGVASFSEGLDLPGALCTHVIIAKLFFTVPDSPVEHTRSEWLESQGRNPFVEISVPDASFKLIQAVGRLLRTETDSGRVTVLDRRLVETRYGQQMLEALPPFKRTIERAARTVA